MAYKHIVMPPTGEKVTVKNGKLHVPDNPIIGYVEGDGIGPDITRACLRLWDAFPSRDPGCAQGPDHLHQRTADHAGRRRFQVAERRPAAGSGPVRLYPSGALRAVSASRRAPISPTMSPCSRPPTTLPPNTPI